MIKTIYDKGTSGKTKVTLEFDADNLRMWQGIFRFVLGCGSYDCDGVIETCDPVHIRDLSIAGACVVDRDSLVAVGCMGK